MIIYQHNNIIPLLLISDTARKLHLWNNWYDKMYTVNGDGGEFKVDFDCPYIGTNKCNLSGKIPGLKFTRLSFSGPSGSVASCIMKIENK